MLVLTRKVDESVSIADGEIMVTVLSIRGDKVRLGFKAANEIKILRTELGKFDDDLVEGSRDDH